MADSSRQEEIREIHRKHRLFYELLGGAVLLLIGVVIGASFFDSDNRNDYHMNLATEALGIAATVFIINRWYAHRDRESLKRRLLREVRMPSNDIVLNAIGQMWDEGWLMGNGGLLKGEDLSGANLQNVDLRGANLQDANLTCANLQEAKLQGTNLRGARLRWANLSEAKLNEADLVAAVMENAILQTANFENADMTLAQLQGAKAGGAVFWKTNMEGINMDRADVRNVSILNRVNLENAKMPLIDLGGKDLRCSNLLGAYLFGANLRDTKLIGVNLENANLKGAYMQGALVVASRKVETIKSDNAPIAYAVTEPTILTNTILPDGSRLPERPSNEDLERFTDPNNSEFPETLEKIVAIRQAAGLTD